MFDWRTTDVNVSTDLNVLAKPDAPSSVNTEERITASHRPDTNNHCAAPDRLVLTTHKNDSSSVMVLPSSTFVQIKDHEEKKNPLLHEHRARVDDEEDEDADADHDDSSASSSRAVVRAQAETFPPSVTTNNTTTRSGVKFDKVIIRNYNLTIADNPSCTSGVPIGLSWEYDPQPIEMSVEAYESCRDGRRRRRNQMQMPGQLRFDLLRNEFDVSIREILRVQEEVERAQRIRIKALSQQQNWGRRREMADKIIKTANRRFRTLLISNCNKEKERIDDK